MHQVNTLKIIDLCLIWYLQKTKVIKFPQIKAIACTLGVSTFLVQNALERLVEMKLVSVKCNQKYRQLC